MKKKKPISKEELSPWIPDLSYTRFIDQRIVPNTPAREKKEFWPNEGVYKTKMKRA